MRIGRSVAQAVIGLNPSMVWSVAGLHAGLQLSLMPLFTQQSESMKSYCTTF